MGLHVVEAACQLAPDRSRGTIVLESDITAELPLAIEELGTTEARNLALSYAAQCGIPDPRINGNLPGAYPINGKGASLDQVRDNLGQALPPQHPDMQIARYRIDVPVCRKLI